MRQNEREEREMTSEERAVIEAAAGVIVCKENFYFQLKALKQLESALCALENATPPATKPGHVKVRAAVAVAADGEWAVYGHRDEDDTVVATQAAHLTSSSRPDEYFIEAQVPLPKPPATIQAHVEAV